MIESLTREDVRRFQLPCGCMVADTPDGPSIDWCPHHEMLHGIIPTKRQPAEERESSS